MFGTDEISDNIIRRKLKFITVVITIGFCVLVLRLGYLQIVCARYYVEKSINNRIHPVRFIPPRGVLHDRSGKEPLADNEIAFDVCVSQEKASYLCEMDKWRREALRRLNLTPEDIQKNLKKLKANVSTVTFEPIIIKEDVDKDTIAYLAENNSHIPEIIIRARPKRRYERLAVHVIGYTAPVSEADLKNGYVMNDVMGKAGVEAEYEEYLKGELGWKMVEVNAFGHMVRELPMPIKVKPGQNLNLTLDPALQKKAEAALEGKVGAVIAIDPRNGDILVMASKPDFDPSIFMSGCSEKDWNDLVNSYDRPLLNRAIMGEYPPGSTFKIVTATTALEEGKIDESTTFCCNGAFRLGNRTFRCHKAGGHGCVTIHEALPKSCNVFFYNVAYNKGVTVPMMHKYALMYGLGKKTGIDLPGERHGFIPGVSKYPGDKVNMAIGQGTVLVTPLQMANLICVIANRGFSYKPHVINLSNGTHELLVDLRGQVSSKTIDIIRGALWNVAKFGLNRQAKLKDIQTGGKTGTAQNPHGDEHAWFIGFAPFDNPEIAIAVVVENAGLGSVVAAPIAGQVLAEYFYKSQPVVKSQQSIVASHQSIVTDR